jgi:hypothetical protein
LKTRIETLREHLLLKQAEHDKITAEIRAIQRDLAASEQTRTARQILDSLPQGEKTALLHAAENAEERAKRLAAEAERSRLAEAEAERSRRLAGVPRQTSLG